MIWMAVLLTSAGCFLLKLAGLALPQAWLAHRRIQQAAALLPIALLAALTAVQAVAVGSRLVLDARLAGLAAGVLALLLRAPFLVVVGVAAAAAALVRAAG